MDNKYGIIYFSGTGNTELLANFLGRRLNTKAHSIEEELNWKDYIKALKRIVILYPIHYSVPPMFMRKFLKEYYHCFENKEIISIACQMMYSGDGGRAVEDFLPSSAKLIDIHHVNMPNNIPNISFLPVTSDGGNRRKTKRALRKIDKIAQGIRQEAFKRRHTSSIAVKMGDIQREPGLAKEDEKKEQVWVSDDCIKCGLCVRSCPTGNFVMKEKAEPQGDCTLCLRCENNCPVNAITVLFDRPFKRQYKGPIYK